MLLEHGIALFDTYSVAANSVAPDNSFCLAI